MDVNEPAAGLGPGHQVLGPEDRESFFAAQRRYRRQTWRLVLFCYLAAVLGCIPASIVLSPLLFAVLLLVGRLAELAGWLSPDFVSGLIHRVADALSDTVAYAIYKVFGGEVAAAPSWDVLVVVIVAMLVPGMVAMLVLWLLVYGAFARAGVGGVLLAMGAREVNPADPKDRQLANVVAEMAIAANVPQPRVAILDEGDANVAFVGSNTENAVIVVSRALLDQMNRDQIQGAIGHAVGAIGNGDLRIAFRVLTVSLAMELSTRLPALINTPETRRLFGRILVLLFRRKTTPAYQKSADELTHTLLNNAGDPGDPKGCLLLIPVMYLWISTAFASIIPRYMFVKPVLNKMWRTRRYLADASAVQLTRHPDGLASALKQADATAKDVVRHPRSPAEALRNTTHAPSGGEAAELLFVMPTSEISGTHPKPWKRMRRLNRLGATVPPINKKSPWTVYSFIVLPFVPVLLALLIALILIVYFMATAMMFSLLRGEYWLLWEAQDKIPEFIQGIREGAEK
jgi:Zn-dependent protease with chaperone function